MIERSCAGGAWWRERDRTGAGERVSDLGRMRWEWDRVLGVWFKGKRRGGCDVSVTGRGGDARRRGGEIGEESRGVAVMDCSWFMGRHGLGR